MNAIPPIQVDVGDDGAGCWILHIGFGLAIAAGCVSWWVWHIEWLSYLIAVVVLLPGLRLGKWLAPHLPKAYPDKGKGKDDDSPESPDS
ncbi:hypothetical protein [Mangrovactinospora gilvigrisea]|uniref:hypothetical protein n=1 Tax=Mangrovactinospora gilvigrisea TaxID=1428644 RepID=UPI000AF3A88B|nr:hypothetical protein [Mangrovactinospora gilvigrisea]